MKQQNNNIHLIFFTLFLWSADALAYIDPGSGLLLWQGLLAFLVSAIVIIRNPILAVRRLFRFIRDYIHARSRR
jgi:hypothetical protein